MAASEAIRKITRGILCACFLSGTLGGAACADDHASEHVGAVAERTRDAVEAGPAGLPLSGDVAKAAQMHMRLSEESGARPSIEKACALARSAQQLVPLLAASLESEHASLVSRGVDSDNASALDAFERRTELADTRLVGIGLRVGAEVVYGYVRYDEIADAGVSQNDGAMLFRAVARLWDDPTGWPVHIQQQTDVTGCHDPGALIEPLEDLGRVWNRAPECARSVVIDIVRQSVRSALSSASCYCHARGESIADTARLVELADELRFGIPAPEVDALWMHLRRDDVRFECLAR